jgi:hypothetical protein
MAPAAPPASVNSTLSLDGTVFGCAHYSDELIKRLKCPVLLPEE